VRECIQILIGGLASGAVYALVAYGFNFTYATSGVLNFAQGDLVMVGALLSYAATVQWHLGWFVAFICICIAAVVNIVIYLIGVRPLRNVGATYSQSIMWMLSTFGAALILESIARIIWGNAPLRVPSPVGERTISAFGINIFPQQILVFCAVLVIALLIWRFQRGTIVGNAMSAVAFSAKWASLNGISPQRLVLLSFGVAGGLGGLAGYLLAPITYAQADMGLGLAISGFTVSVIGGLGESRGTLVSSLALGVLQSIVAWKLPSVGGDIFVYAILVAVLLVRPFGLFGKPVGLRA
jgi:branched-chain amino acid transport system permease protein